MRHDVPRSMIGLASQYRSGIQAEARRVLAILGGRIAAKQLAELIGLSPQAIDGYLSHAAGFRKTLVRNEEHGRLVVWYMLEPPSGGTNKPAAE